jgi:two-component system response regulator|tara:strand:+ start:175 stop:591 length:417 start_codon:yes stop_codon:yes gene_type:complete
LEERKIILIEDDPDHADLITEALGEEDLEKCIILVRDGMEAIDYFQEFGVTRDEQIENKVKLVILDLHLPKVDGMDVLKFLKKNPKYSKIPVIILSTSSNQETINEAYKYGANGYFVKSASYEEFVKKVNDCSHLFPQ